MEERVMRGDRGNLVIGREGRRNNGRYKEEDKEGRREGE